MADGAPPEDSAARDRTRTAWGLTGFLAVLAFVASVVPVPLGDRAVGSIGPVPLDAVAHFLGYAALGASLASVIGARRDDSPVPGWPVAIALVAVVTVYGAGLEAVQTALPWRQGSMVDVAANALGAVLGVGAMLGWQYR